MLQHVMFALVLQQLPSPQHSLPPGQQSGLPWPAAQGAWATGHAWQVPRAGFVHAKPGAQHVEPHVRSSGQQLPLTHVSLPGQHCPLQQAVNGPQQLPPQG